VWKQLLIGVALVAFGACEKSSTPSLPDPLAGVELATVPTKIADVGSADVVVAKTAFTVDGKAIVPIANGAIADAEKEGGKYGMKLPNLLTALMTLPRKDTLTIALDRSTPYPFLVDVMYTAKQKPLAIHQFALVARAKDTNATTALIVKLPDTPSVAAAFPVGDHADHGGVVAGETHPSRITVADKAGGTGSSLTPDLVMAKIQTVYMAAIKRCYKTELAHDATAHGKVKLELSVDETGRIAGAHAEGFIADCVTPLMQTWRFPVPKPAPASFQISLQLVPDDAPGTVVAVVGGSGSDPAPRLPLQMFVAASGSDFIMWSMSGTEGTLQAPKLRVPISDPDAATKIRAALAEIANRNFGGPVPVDQRQVIFMGSATIQAASFLPVMAAMQSVFPELLLSSGFE
jgi:hypothetical protein